MFHEYTYIVIPFIAMLFAQIIKFTIESLKEKRIVLGRLFNGSGGMPSSHNAFVFSITTSIGIKEGITSTFFSIALIFSMVIMYDSMVHRMQTENHAKTINRLVDNLINGDTKKSYKIMKEEVGHKPIETVAGVILGILVAFVFS